MSKAAKEVEVAEVKVKVSKRVKGVSKDAAISVLADANPKRAGSKSFDRFEGYLTDPAPTTVQEALDNGLTMGDIHYDLIAGSITVEGAEVEEYTPVKREAKADDADAEVTEVEAETEDQF